MFTSAKKLERLYEARVEDLKAAHKTTVKALADEIDYLRAQVYGASALASGPTPARIPAFEEPDLMPSASPLYMNEELEDLEALRTGGHINEVEYGQIKRGIESRLGLPISVDQSF